MAVNLKTVASRLQKARQTLAYSLEEASSLSGLDQNRLNEIELGKAKPSGDEVLILASIYDCDFRAFIDESLPPPAQQTEILFRRYGDSISTSDRRAIQEFLYFCQMEDALEKKLGREVKPFTFVPSGTFLKAHGQQAAEALRLHLGYSEGVNRDIYEDFRSIGIHIFRKKLSNSDISGLYIEDPIAGHCVLINYNEDIYRQRFSVGHEVAHAIFDSSEGVMLTYDPSSSKYNKDDLVEVRANSFSSHYLMPVPMLKRLNISDESSGLHWAQKLRVSTAALAKALIDAKLINESLAQKIRSVRVPKKDKIDPEAPESLTQKQKDRRLALMEHGLSDHYVDLCFTAQDRGLITIGRLAEVLRVHHSELPDVGLLFGRTLAHGV